MTAQEEPVQASARALAQLRREMGRSPFHAVLDPQPISADAELGIVVVSMKAKPEFRRAHDSDFLHGGVIASLIDLTAHAAVAVRTGRPAPTIDLRVDYLRPAAGDLVATGKLLRAGRSVARSDVEVCDGQGRIVAVGRGVFSTTQPD